MKRKLLAGILGLAMLISLIPVPAHAADNTAEDETSAAETAILGADSAETDVSQYNCHEMTELWFGKTENAALPRAVNAIPTLDEAIQAYFDMREADLQGADYPRTGGAVELSPKVQEDATKRRAAIQKLQDVDRIVITDGSVTAETISRSEDAAGGTISLYVYEWTFYDYHHIQETYNGESTAGYETYHSIMIQKTDKGYIVLADEYDELDVLQISTVTDTERAKMISLGYLPDTSAFSPTFTTELNEAQSTSKAPTVYTSVPQYDPDTAVAYADRWVKHVSYDEDNSVRNPAYDDCSAIGGDCANYVSQCLEAGGMQRSTKEDGWKPDTVAWRGSKPLCAWCAENWGREIKLTNETLKTETLKGSPMFITIKHKDGSLSVKGHAMLCVGHNADGYPIYNAHTSDRWHYPLRGVDCGAWTVQLIPCDHTYDGIGICTKCGRAKDYEIDKDLGGQGTYRAINDTKVHRTPYGKSPAYILPAGKTVNVEGALYNTEKNLWYKTEMITQDGRTEHRYVYSERVQKVPTKIFFTGIQEIGTIQQGQAHNLTGTISSEGSPITSIEAVIMTDTEGMEVGPTKIVSGLNTNSYALRGSALDNKVAFGALEPGLYHLSYDVKTEDGTWATGGPENWFEVVDRTPPPPPRETHLTFSNIVTPGDIPEKSHYSIEGSVQSDGSPIVCVEAIIYNAVTGAEGIRSRADGFRVQKYSPFSHSKLNDRLNFAALKPGVYYIHYLAKAEDGTQAAADTGEFRIVGAQPHTCDKGAYKFYESAHPHYNAYRCSICGEIWHDTSSSNYYDQCPVCNQPGKAVLTASPRTCMEGESVTITWTNSKHTTHYNFWLWKKGTSGTWDRLETRDYASSGITLTLPAGEYRALVVSTNSNFYEPDGRTWLYTDSDPVFFTVEEGYDHNLQFAEKADGTLEITGYNGKGAGDLVIPDKINGKAVTSIGKNAFMFDYGFKGRLVIPDTVTSIGENAFYDCKYLNGELRLPQKLISVHQGAFSGCAGFTGPLVIPDSVTTIGRWAFSDCSGLTGPLTIPDGVTDIGGGAFFSCSGFRGKLTLPKNLKNIGVQAFFGCKGFTGALILPESVINIGEEAFSGCAGFTGKLSLPDGITDIPEFVFAGCKGFTGSLELPLGVVHIGDCAFANCGGLTGDVMIPEKVTQIGSWAFRGCTGLRTLRIPAAATQVEGGRLFGGMEIAVAADNPVYAAADGILFSKDLKTLISCPAGKTGGLTIPVGTEKIKYGAFADCSGLTGTLVIPNTVTEIGSSAFDGCTGFTGELIIPNSVTRIGDFAFDGCQNLAGFAVIPRGVSTLEAYVFTGCTSLTGLYLPETITSIERGAAEDTGLTDVYYGGTEAQKQQLSIDSTSNDLLLNAVWHYGIVFGAENKVIEMIGAIGEVTLESEQMILDARAAYEALPAEQKNLVTNLAVLEAAEAKLEELKTHPYMLTYREKADGTLEITGYTGTAAGELILPSEIDGKTVTSIGAHAFDGCKGFTGGLTLPDTITYVDEFAFYNCDGFTGGLTLPDSVKKVYDYAFADCGGLAGGLTLPAEMSMIGRWAFMNSGFTGPLVLPEKLTYLGCSAFSFCKGFTGDLVIPKQISFIDHAFNNCSGFTGSLTLPDGLTSIGAWSFQGCGFTGELKIPETVTDIDVCAFMKCKGFTGNLVLPKNLTVIHGQAFSGCSGLTGELVLPNGITQIELQAFQNCSGFTGSLSIPAGVTSIGQDSFRGCTGLTGSVIIHEGASSIEHSAFKDCRGITEVFLPVSMTNIAFYAFDGCTSLASVCYAGTETQKQQISFYNGNSPLLNAAWQYNTAPVGTEPVLFSINDCPDGYEGETFILDVSMENNPGVTAVDLDVSYDASKLKLIKAEDTGLLRMGTFAPTYTENPYGLSWPDDSAQADNTANGVIARLTFQILDDCGGSTTEVLLSASPDRILNCQGQSVPFKTVSGSIGILPRVYGDVNSDHTVDQKDVIRLGRTLGGWEGYTVPAKSADVDRSGRINAVDLGLVTRYAAKWPGIELGKPLAPASPLAAAGRISVSQAEGQAGDTVRMILRMEKNPGIVLANLQLHYNTEQLRLLRVENGTVLTEFLSPAEPQKLPYQLLWNDSLSAENTRTGELAILTFEILPGCAEGTVLPVSLTCEDGNLLDGALQTVKFTLEAGAVQVLPAPRTITELRITRAPNKVSYTAGEKFDSTGMEVSAVYSDGSQEPVSGWIVTDGASLRAGQTSVTVSYGGHTVTQTVQVFADKGVTPGKFRIRFSLTEGAHWTDRRSTSDKKATVTRITTATAPMVNAPEGREFAGWQAQEIQHTLSAGERLTYQFLKDQFRWEVKTPTIVYKAVFRDAQPPRMKTVTIRFLENGTQIGKDVVLEVAETAEAVTTEQLRQYLPDGYEFSRNSGEYPIDRQNQAEVPVVAAGSVEPSGEPITVTFTMKGMGRLNGVRGKTINVTVTPGCSVEAPFAASFRGAKPLHWTSEDGSLQLDSGNTVTYEQLAELLGGTVPHGAVVTFLGKK